MTCNFHYNLGLQAASSEYVSLYILPQFKKKNPKTLSVAPSKFQNTFQTPYSGKKGVLLSGPFLLL